MKEGSHQAWGHRGNQDSVETTCLATLALRGSEIRPRARSGAQDLQNSNGSWPAFAGDEAEGWATSLAVVSLMAARATRRHRIGNHWLLNARGRSGVAMALKLRTVDNKVQFDPSSAGAGFQETSWVTAFSIISLRQARRHGLNRTAELAERVKLGSNMLFDRMCPGGGWNSGNGIAFGVPVAPHIDATSIALLALTGHEADRRQARFLAPENLPGCPSPLASHGVSLPFRHIEALIRKRKGPQALRND